MSVSTSLLLAFPRSTCSLSLLAACNQRLFGGPDSDIAVPCFAVVGDARLVAEETNVVWSDIPGESTSAKHKAGLAERALLL
jgi:hypothetical protein